MSLNIGSIIIFLTYYILCILQDVLSSLWWHISSLKSDPLGVRRDLISSNTKKKHRPRKESSGEVDHSHPFKEGDVPWNLKKDDISMVKDVNLV